MKKYLFLLVMAFFSCTTSEKETPAEENDPAKEVTAEEESVPSDIDSTASEEHSNQPASRVFLDCRMVVENDLDTDTLFIVSLIVRDQTIPVDTIAFCKSIQRSEYSTFDIPSLAVDACGGWHEDAGEYFYIIEDGLDLIVRHAWLKEEQTTNSYPYKEALRLKLPEIDL